MQAGFLLLIRILARKSLEVEHLERLQMEGVRRAGIELDCGLRG
jgi:hypothetical protein